jgi:demethylmenaquinone methyltransferase/2-methoxy-6-polyprenyl-1,4-benzoquinol methylase
MERTPSARKPLPYIIERYDRVARFYRTLEPLFLIHGGARRRAIAELELGPAASVLEVGVGTGRNLAYMEATIGPTGQIIGVDASPGMLAVAHKAVQRRRWANVELLLDDATTLHLDCEVDAVLFSLSYSVIPEAKTAFTAAWNCLRPGGRVVILDLGLTDALLHRLLRPLARLLVRLGPGDPFSRPWEDLTNWGPVRTQRFFGGLYYTCVIDKPQLRGGSVEERS